MKDYYEKKLAKEERERRRKRNTAVFLILIGFICTVALFAVGYCNVHAPCEVWKGSTIDQIPARCIGELTR